MVYALSAGGDPLHTLIFRLREESFIDSKVRDETYGVNASAGGKIAVVSIDGNINASVNIHENEQYFTKESELRKLLKKAKEKGYTVLISIDDIAKSDDMISFLSAIGMILMEPEYDVKFLLAFY